MRKILAISLTGIALVSGCTRWNILKGPEGAKNEPVGKAPSADQLVRYLNDNSSRINAIRSTDLDMTCSVGLQQFGVRGKMMAQKPKNFLLAADVFGSREVDLGSNDQEFWWWIKKNDPPYQFFCSYQDLASGRVRQLPLPFQPEWIVDALGMGNYGPADRYRLEVEATKLKLVEKAVSPQGQPVRKIIVMNRKPVRAPTPQVTDFLLLDDATGKEICAAHISETQMDSGPKGRGGMLPRRIEFRWAMPEGRTLRLAMTVDGLNVNPDVSAGQFRRQTLSGVPSYDLATGKLTALQQAQNLR